MSGVWAEWTQTAGGWNSWGSKDISFSFSTDSPHGGLRGTRLLTWWLKATRGTGPRETSRNYVAFSNPTSEVTQCHFYNILFIKTVTVALPGAKKGDTDFPFWWDECRWIFRHVSASLLHIWETWKEMNTSSLAFKELEFELGASVFRQLLVSSPKNSYIISDYFATPTHNHSLCLVTMDLWPSSSCGQAGRVRVSFHSHIFVSWVLR